MLMMTNNPPDTIASSSSSGSFNRRCSIRRYRMFQILIVATIVTVVHIHNVLPTQTSTKQPPATTTAKIRATPTTPLTTTRKPPPIPTAPPTPTPTTLTTAIVAPWRTSTKIPAWMKQYFQWHQEARANITKTKGTCWQQYQYLVIRCLDKHDFCGGTSDRLRALPFVLLLASRTNRLLFYHWEFPCALQELLIPPVDGLDWTWPPYPNHPDLEQLLHKQVPKMQLYDASNTSNGVLKIFTNYSNCPLVSYAEKGRGGKFYDKARSSRDEASFGQVYSDVWHSVFVPSPPVQNRINSEIQRLQTKLSDRRQHNDHSSSSSSSYHAYHAIHIRSRYKSILNNETMYEHVINATNCLQEIVLAKQLQEAASSYNSNTSVTVVVVKGLLTNGTTIFVASDDVPTKQAVAAIAQEQHGIAHVVTAPTTTVDQNNSNKNEGPPPQVVVHLERANDFVSTQRSQWVTLQPQDYYGIIVDFYLLSQAECLVTGVGVSISRYLYNIHTFLYLCTWDLERPVSFYAVSLLYSHYCFLLLLFHTKLGAFFFCGEGMLCCWHIYLVLWRSRSFDFQK